MWSADGRQQWDDPASFLVHFSKYVQAAHRSVERAAWQVVRLDFEDLIVVGVGEVKRSLLRGRENGVVQSVDPVSGWVQDGALARQRWAHSLIVGGW